MNCEQAKALIDARVQELSAGGAGSASASASTGSAEWAALDAHLAKCARCRAELEELERTRGLLAELATDRPNDAEIQKMWTGIQTAAVIPSRPALVRGTGWWVRNKGLLLSLGSVAAVLALAFYVGEMRYTGSARISASRVVGISQNATNFSSVDSSLPTSTSVDYDAPVGVPPYLSPSADTNEIRDRAKSAAQERLTRRGVLPNAGGGGNGGGQGVFQGSSAEDARRIQLQMRQSPQEPPPPSAPALADRSSYLSYKADEAKQTFGVESVTPSESQDREAPKAEADGLADSQQAAQESAVPQNLKIIKTGELTLEVAAHAGAAEQVGKIVAQHGGFIADATTQEESGGALVGRIVVRVPPDRFEQVFAALKPLGRVQSENVKAADVTAEYVDTDARIKSLQITEERLRELIANKSFVDKISSLLEVERELNRVRTEIEKLQGQLRVMDDRISLSTIVLTLREPGRTVPSASLSVEVITLDEAAAKLAEVLAQAGGRLISGHTSKRGDGTLMGNYQLETTLARFADVVTAIERLGRVQERQVTDQQFKTADESWANRVKCAVALVLFERSRQLPSGSIYVEVDGVEDAVTRMGEILEAHEATMASNQTNGTAEGATGATIQVHVPAGRFAELLEAIAGLGRVTNRSSYGEAGAIVGGAAAVPCDLTVTLAEKPREVPRGGMAIEVTAFDPARQALSKAIRERQVQVLHSSSNQRTDGTWQGTFRLGVPAKEMESFVSTLEGLGRVTGRQISGLGLGDLSRVNPDALGTIELVLGEKTSIAPGPDQASGSIRARIRDGLTGFYSSVGMIAYGLVVLAPWLVLAILAGWLLIRIRRGRTRGTAVAQVD